MQEYIRHVAKLPEDATPQDVQAQVSAAFEDMEDQIHEKVEEVDTEEQFIALMRDTQEVYEDEVYVVIHAFLTTEHKPEDEEFEEARGKEAVDKIEIVNE